MNAPTTPAGWYPDPTGKGHRYWDGRAWAAEPAPPPKKPKGGKIAAGIVAAIVALVMIGNLGDEDKESTTSSPSSTESSFSFDATAVPAAAPAPVAPPVPVVLPGIGEEVRDGKFAFIITSVDRSAVAGDLSNQFMREEAQGEFVNVHLTITNVGNEAQTFFASNQKLMAAGREYEADTMAAVWTDSSSEEINPGNSIAAVVSFDVPPGTVPQSISLHDSMFSGGVDVGL